MDQLPVVKQCNIDGHPQLGAVAVQDPDNPERWMIGHPKNGGHWATASDGVDAWATLAAPEIPFGPAPQ